MACSVYFLVCVGYVLPDALIIPVLSASPFFITSPINRINADISSYRSPLGNQEQNYTRLYPTRLKWVLEFSSVNNVIQGSLVSCWPLVLRCSLQPVVREHFMGLFNLCGVFKLRSHCHLSIVLRSTRSKFSYSAEWRIGFSWTVVWALCYWRMYQTCSFLQSIIPT